MDYPTTPSISCTSQRKRIPAAGIDECIELYEVDNSIQNAIIDAIHSWRNWTDINSDLSQKADYYCSNINNIPNDK